MNVFADCRLRNKKLFRSLGDGQFRVYGKENLKMVNSHRIPPLIVCVSENYINHIINIIFVKKTIIKLICKTQEITVFWLHFFGKISVFTIRKKYE